MRLDTLVAKPEHLFPTNNTPFCGSPIYGMDTLAMEDAHSRDIENRVCENRRTPVENRAEVMPGEIICPDNIIRRTTTREVTGKHEALMSNSLSMWCPRGQSVDDAGEPIESPVPRRRASALQQSAVPDSQSQTGGKMSKSNLKFAERGTGT